MEQLHGYIERITYQNEENGYTVARLKAPRRAELICVVGALPGLQPGETVRLWGEWKQHLVYGQQFEVKRHETEAPADVEGIRKYLGSGLIKGIGPVNAGRIVKLFGKDTLKVIDETPERLQEVPGIGRKRIKMIKVCWEEQKSIREVMIFLQAHGVSPAYAQKIFKVYGAKSIEKVQEDPFRLARDIFGIGFKMADQIAQDLGIEKDAPQRVEAGIEHVLGLLSNEGHVCCPATHLVNECEAILEVDRDLIEHRLIFLEGDNRVKRQGLVLGGVLTPCIWIRSLYLAEQGIAREIIRLTTSPGRLRQVDTDRAITWVQELLKIELAENQKKAVAQALEDKFQIITGGPGTGKSTITNAILTITGKLTSQILLAAPTGRAAKRMSEITGKKASTIHSLLEFDFRVGGFKKNSRTPLECDLLIVDEASMIDTLLMYHLLKAVPDHARVVFVGDINQLPSVGPGNVLKDMIVSATIPVTMLTEIFRQAAGSQIITNAHRINSGNQPDTKQYAGSDFFFLEYDEAEAVLNQIVGLVTQRLPRKYGYDPLREIQVLAPMKKGIIGTENLNYVLQQALNPQKEVLMRMGRRFGVGDKVMQLRNNYQKEVYNGDIGLIKSINFVDQQLVVTVEEKEITYSFTEADELVLAYAVSIHKYQGSECRSVVIPVHTSHYKLLHRNLLYTGVTRGKELVVLVGMKKALHIAVSNDEVKRRYTGLRQALIEAHSPSRPGAL